jgi:hypothetical protein
MKKILLVLSFAGLIFSGYMSSVKFFSQSCAFGETCPYFLGLPACYYGFGMYVIITILVLWLALTRYNGNRLLNYIISISAIGVIFAGSFTIDELPLLFENGVSAYLLGLPTCTWGLLFYIAILVVAIIARRKGVDGQNI